MEEKILSTKIRVYSYNELTDTRKKLVELAREATRRAYAPFSKFNVGAALLLGNGEIVTGSNQENVAFPSGTCAERTTVFYASSRYPGVPFEKLAIAAWHDGDFVETPTAPCGACRQAILEYETLGGKPIEIILCGRNEVYVVEDGIKALLPLCFDKFLPCCLT